jgi:glycosyltransferase involved in cell wall biosynthesis
MTQFTAASGFSIMFILPVSGGSGGAHSVMQEADAMRSLGIDAVIATNEGNAARLKRGYKDLSTIHNYVISYANPGALGSLLTERRPDIVVATTNQSVHVLAEAMELANLRNQRTAYYIQDYEPLFYARGTNEWNIAYSSYGKIPGCVHFAKTRWLQDVVLGIHGVSVEKVEPSIDHGVYYPNLSEKYRNRGRFSIVAMVRPSTARRAPRRTARIMNRIAAEYSDKVNCITFGCSSDDLQRNSLRLFGVEHRGLLSRQELGELFREADLFLDLSDFQAFGRTAIEAMSCGTVAIVPAHGGTYEYAVDGKNCFIVDTRSDEKVLSAFQQWLAMSDSQRMEISLEGVKTGFRYTPQTAALSLLSILL